MLSSLWRRISLSSRIALSGSLVLVLVIAILLYSVIQEEVARLRTEFALKITSDLAILVPTLTEQAILGDYSTIRQVLTPYAERPGSIGNSASIMASATPFVSLCEAKALKHLRKGAFEDSDIMRSAHKWPTR